MRSESEFKKIYYDYYKSLSLFCCKYVELEVAEDIVQDVFLKFWHVDIQFENERHILSYLLKATKHKCLNYLRLNKLELSDIEDAAVDEQQWDESMELEFMESNLYVNIFNAIEQLPARRKQIFTMSYLDKMSVDEISQKLNISTNTVKTQRLRAKEALRKYLEDDYRTLSLFSVLFL
ncbi:MAG: RNA polymerase sigma factor [Draconibacterium sp.]